MSDTTLPAGLTAGVWDIETTHSSVGFTVRHLGLSKVRGRFNTFGGSVTVGNSVDDVRVEATVDFGSIDTGNAQRDGHLRGGDFFEADAHPEMRFVSTGVSGASLRGELTIMGTTRPVEFDLEVHGVTTDGRGVTRAGFTASGHIHRSEFGVAFNAPLGLDGMLISDKVAIELEVQAVPRA